MQNLDITIIQEILKTCSIGFIVIDDQHKVINVNQHGAELLEYTPEEMIGTDLNDYILGNPNHDIKAKEFIFDKSSDAVARSMIPGAAEAITKTGKSALLSIQIHRLSNGMGYAVFRDPASDAVGDSLTKALTREQFFSKMNKLEGDFSLLFIDLNKFKEVNDTFGHSAGDSVLKTVAKRIKHILRDTDIFCRYGGDEFIIVVPGNEIVARIVRAKIENLVGQPIRTRSETVAISCSIGVAQSTEATNIDDLIHIADTRMYSDKD